MRSIPTSRREACGVAHMNNTIYYDATISDDLRRKRLFDGQLFIYSPVSSSTAFIEFARSMIEDAFGGRDPRVAQDNMDVEEYAGLLGKLKPEFIHHPEIEAAPTKYL